MPCVNKYQDEDPQENPGVHALIIGVSHYPYISGGAAIYTDNEKELNTVTLPDDLSLTVIGPPRNRLRNFIPKWNTELKKAFASGRLTEISSELETYGRIEEGRNEIETYGRGEKPILRGLKDLINLAGFKSNDLDDSHANGSSIALILEYEGKRILLSGDAFALDLINGIRAYTNDLPLKLDAFKVPHHGSLKNISSELIECIDCKNWLISTDGTRFKHPDASAIARIIHHSLHKHPSIHFNVKSEFNSWWENQKWQEKFKYQTIYGTDSEGLNINF